MKLRMEIIDQRNRECVEHPKPFQTTVDYSKLWEMIMGMGIMNKSISSTAPTVSVQPFERASKKVFEKAAAPEWGTKEWFYNTSIQAKEWENQHTDAYGQVFRWSAFT